MDSPAAKQMVKKWDNIDTWWKSDKVQNARLKFCHEFSRSSDNLISELEFFFEIFLKTVLNKIVIIIHLFENEARIVSVFSIEAKASSYFS